MAYKIEVDKNLCIGCGACVATCNNFKMVSGKAKPVKDIVNDIGCNQDASDCCPVSAINIKNADAKKK